MKTYFPYYFKKIGIILFIISIVLSTLSTLRYYPVKTENKQNIEANSSTDLIEQIANPFTEKTRNILKLSGLVFSFIGLIIYIFSKEKIEDEFIQNLRYKSLAKSLVITWIVYGLIFISKDAFNPEGIEVHWQTDGLYVLQFQLFIYILIFHRKKKKWKF